MFRSKSKKDPLLPLGGGSGRPSTAGSKVSFPIPELGVFQWASWIWLGVSLFLVVFGGLHSRWFSQGASLKCSGQTCDYAISAKGVDLALTLNKNQLVRADLVRMKRGQIIDVKNFTRKQQRKLKQTYALFYRPDHETPEVHEQLLMAPIGTTRKKGRSRITRINDYIKGKTSSVEIYEQQHLTIGGAIMIAIGLISLVFSLLLGEFTKPKKRQKKSS